MEIKKECTLSTTDSKIKCEENKRKIIFINKNRDNVDKITVDDCQITSGLRCDYLVKHAKKEYFVELKGEDIKHAFQQLARSISILGSDDCQLRKCFVISSRSPLASAQIQNVRLQFKRKYSSDLIVKNISFEEDL
ncbi:hypothetical protein [Labilibaculum euxinus]